MIVYFIIGFIVTYFVINLIIYRRSDYYRGTHNSYLKTQCDKGCFGEYTLSKKLTPFLDDGAKILYNSYIPKDDGKTTEVDLIMIYKTGIYVFENKNYGGSIYGAEDKKTWYQIFHNKYNIHREEFYNPIMQNSTHIRWIKRQLHRQLHRQVPMYSIVTFADRANLRNVHCVNADIRVCNHSAVCDNVNNLSMKTPAFLTESEIDAYYELLLPFTNASEFVKKQHINDIKI